MNTLRQDSLAGIVVFLVALPLCLGIAQASGLPPFVGLLTGTGGGVLRDVLAGDMPYILRKHIYASASIAGGILYLLLRQVWQGPGAVLTGVVVVVVIRCAAAHFEWNLPRAKTVWKSDE